MAIKNTDKRKTGTLMAKFLSLSEDWMEGRTGNVL